MALTANNDLVTLSANFESLKAKVEAIEIIVYGEKVLELDDSTWEDIRKKRDYILKSTDWTVVKKKRLYFKIYRLDCSSRM